MIWNKLKPQKMFVTLLLSYLILFLLPMLVGSLFYAGIADSTRENVYKYNLSLLEQARSNMDVYLKEIDTIAYQICGDSTIATLMNSTSVDPDSRMDDYVTVSKALKEYTFRATYIYDIFVYLEDSDTVITTSAVTTLQRLFDTTSNYIYYDYPKWQETFFEGVKFKQYYPSMPIRLAPHTQNVVTYSQSIPISNLNGIKAYLMIQLESNRLLSILKDVNAVSGGETFIFDEKGNTILSTLNSGEDFSHLVSRAEKGSDIYEYKDDRIVMYAMSKQNKWLYMTVMPMMQFIKQSELLYKWSMIILVVYIVISATTVYWSIRNNYSPIRKIANSLRDNNVSDKGFNEIELIRHSIETSAKNEEDLSNIIDNQQRIMFNDFLLKILNGETDCLTEKILTAINFKTVSDKFAVMVIMVDNCDSFIKSDTIREWDLIKFAISNIVLEMLREKSMPNVADVARNKLAVIINFVTDDEIDEEIYMKDIAANLCNFLDKEFLVKIIVGISSVYEMLENVNKCYREAFVALDYKSKDREQSVVSYTDIKEQSNTDFYYYPLEIEKKILNYVNAGSFEDVGKSIDDILTTNLGAYCINPESKRYLYYDLLATYMKALNMLCIENSDLEYSMDDNKRNITESGTLEDVILDIKKKFERLGEYTIEHNIDKGNSLIDSIQDFVREKYMNSNLSMNMIAEQFSITPQYLSSFYRAKTGDKLIDFIARVRIEEVKRLLADKTLTIWEIANMVGYSNDIGLIRMFKKHEGVTPGKYRENQNIEN